MVTLRTVTLVTLTQVRVRIFISDAALNQVQGDVSMTLGLSV